MDDGGPITRLEPGDEAYPPDLSRGGRAPVISARGNLALLDTPGLGFCGSRKASTRGLAVATDCAEQSVAAGFTLISGNATGVDFAAHRAALATGGATILVLPEGIDRFRIRRDLRPVWDWSRALVLSIFPDNAVWRAHQAMQRNETIIALSRAMIVIEAGETGGTLAAGLRTLELHNPLFVADYENVETVAPGNARLLSEGAERLRRSRETGRANVAALRDLAPRPAAFQAALL